MDSRLALRSRAESMRRILLNRARDKNLKRAASAAALTSTRSKSLGHDDEQ